MSGRVLVRELFPTLRQTLGAYFNQDWPDDYSDDDAVMREILENSDQGELRLLVNELEMAISMVSQLSLSDEQVSRLFDWLGICLSPGEEEFAHGKWLIKLRDLLKSHINDTPGSLTDIGL